MLQSFCNRKRGGLGFTNHKWLNRGLSINKTIHTTFICSHRAHLIPWASLDATLASESSDTYETKPPSLWRWHRRRIHMMTSKTELSNHPLLTNKESRHQKGQMLYQRSTPRYQVRFVRRCSSLPFYHLIRHNTVGIINHQPTVVLISQARYLAAVERRLIYHPCRTHLSHDQGLWSATQ